jgi:large subunit ribosomal protein L28
LYRPWRRGKAQGSGLEATAKEKGEVMAKRCEVCGKGPVVGRTISHAHNVGPRRFEPNLQTVRALINGATKRIRVCTRCLRGGKVVKAA